MKASAPAGWTGWPQAGALACGNGASGTRGAINPSISLIGEAPNSVVGADGVLVLSDGNYAVLSAQYSAGLPDRAGAVTRAMARAALMAL